MLQHHLSDRFVCNLTRRTARPFSRTIFPLDDFSAPYPQPSPSPGTQRNPPTRGAPPHQRGSSRAPRSNPPRPRGAPPFRQSSNGFGKAPRATPLPAPRALVLPFSGPYRGPPRKGRGVVAISFGVLWRDGVYSSELEVPLEDGHMETNKSGGYLVITGDGFGTSPASTRAIRVVVSFDSVESILTDSPSAFLNLLFSPSFETYTSSIPAKIERAKAFSKAHQELGAFANRHLRVKFAQRLELAKFSAKIPTLSLPPALVRQVQIEQRRLYASTDLSQLRAWFSSIDVRLAFQLEVVLHEGTLSPQEILALEDDAGTSTQR